MQDLETKSLWSQISGECISGEKEGSKLTQFPATHTTYREFKKLYPNGKLLSKKEKGMTGSVYSNYFSDKTKLGIFGRQDNFQRLAGKDKVLGLRLNNQEIAVAVSYLDSAGYRIIENADETIVVTYNSISKTAAAFILPDIKKNQKADITISDKYIMLGGKKIWNTGSGESVSDKYQDLKARPIVTAYWFAWASFFPETELIVIE